MKLVADMGRVIRLSDRAYRRVLRAIANGQEPPTFTELGAKVLGLVACDTTDLTGFDAAYFLDLDIKSRKKRITR